MACFRNRFSLLVALVVSSLATSGCDGAGWPEGHVCDQELVITFPGMLGFGHPNGDGSYTPLLDGCSIADFDDDKVPAGGDVLDIVDEYDSDLEGERFGWALECYSPRQPGDPPDKSEFDYNAGCQMYWRHRLEDACAGFDAGTVGVAPEDLDYEIEAYDAYCLGEYVQ